MALIGMAMSLLLPFGWLHAEEPLSLKTWIAYAESDLAEIKASEEYWPSDGIEIECNIIGLRHVTGMAGDHQAALLALVEEHQAREFDEDFEDYDHDCTLWEASLAAYRIADQAAALDIFKRMRNPINRVDGFLYVLGYDLARRGDTEAFLTWLPQITQWQAEAVPYYDQLIKNLPEDEDPSWYELPEDSDRYALIELLVTLGLYDLAEEQLGHLAQIDPSDGIHSLAIAAARAFEHDQASATGQDWLDRAQARLAAILDEETHAMAEAEAASDFADAYAHQGDIEAAMRAIARIDEDPSAAAWSLVDVAHAYLRQDMPEQAVTIIQGAALTAAASDWGYYDCFEIGHFIGRKQQPDLITWAKQSRSWMQQPLSRCWLALGIVNGSLTATHQGEGAEHENNTGTPNIP